MKINEILTLTKRLELSAWLYIGYFITSPFNKETNKIYIGNILSKKN